VAANIVEQHGGQLKCANNDGRGTTFRLELPLDRPQRVRRELVVR
jgi:signal transduction histidine kinase